jgi:hypothetical protein
MQFVVGGVYFFIHYRYDIRELSWTDQASSRALIQKAIPATATIERMTTISGVKNIPEMIFVITCRANSIFITDMIFRSDGGQINKKKALRRGLLES